MASFTILNQVSRWEWSVRRIPACTRAVRRVRSPTSTFAYRSRLRVESSFFLHSPVATPAGRCAAGGPFGMSLQIAVAHTGQRLDADPVGFHSVDALKLWISRATEILPEAQVLLTPRGKHVKLQALLTEKEIFVYSRELSTGVQFAVPELALPEPFSADDPPDTLSSHTDLKAWQTLFQARRHWAFAILEKSGAMSQEASQHFAGQATIEKGTHIAVGNHDTHIRGLEQKLQAAKEWFEGVEKETGDNLQRLDADFGQLGSIPAKMDFVQFLTKEVRSAQTGGRTSANRTATLQEFLDVDAVKKATSVSKRVRESFGKRLGSMGLQLEKIGADYDELVGAVGQSQSRSLVDDTEEPMRLYNEIDAVAKKVESDCKHVMGLPANSKSVAQVSKMALLHTRNFLPAIKEYSSEMSDLVRRSVEQKNLAIQNSVDSMRGIASIESIISSLSVELESINIPSEGVSAFELISLVSRLPYIYGTLLVEAVRRREWMDKMEQDTSSLAEEMATFQEEEERRRKRWLKPIADIINVEAVQGTMLGFEMNVQPEKNTWPTITRDDLNEYLRILQGLEGQTAEADALTQAIKDLDRPTKQQVKRAKNFKMGSVHEPAFGKGSQLMLRGDDELRVLKEANTKLEDELKGSKSRIRRLEDLVHRQNHSKLSIGGGMPSFGPQSPADPSTPTAEVASPRLPDELSRRSSISSRRFSTNQGQEDKRRIFRLEQELTAEKEIRASLEKETQANKDGDAELRHQLEEAVSTKTNIMENMKAQQKEFVDERKSLEAEIQHYKSKIEEAEDELDRVLGSRDNERGGVDTKIQELVTDLDKARKEAAEQIQQADERVADLKADLARRKEIESQHRETLSVAFNRLSPETNVPEDQSALISQLEGLALRSFNYQQELKQAVAMAKSENETARSRAQEQETELKLRLSKEEADVASLHEKLQTEKAKSRSITEELEEERGHLHDLRNKFAEGETGSESLRKRVEEEEAKVRRLNVDLAESRSHANSLDVELMRLQKKLSKYEEADSSRSHQRSLRAKELSERLYVQHDRLVRLLETLGFVITYEDGAMVIQRVSKITNSTVMDGNSLVRSMVTTSPTPLKRHLEENSELAFLQWAEATKPEEEDQLYHDLMDSLNRLNIDTFTEAVSKRMRDMEYTARKMQKEARAYRDKSHRFQADAHEKIAYRTFKEGDLALFLPTRNQATRPWAAFNFGAPHYFLREQDSHKLHGREWLVARISKVEERVVDLSRAIDGAGRASMDERSIASNSAVSYEDDNPFELSDGLRWYLLDATEEKPGAPGTPGLGKSTIASTRITGQGHMEPAKKKASNDPAKTLGKSLDSRRSSGTSKNSVPGVANRNSTEVLVPGERGESGSTSNTATRGGSPAAGPGPSHLRESEASGAAGAVDRPYESQDEVRKDLLWGP
ncbi:autophagy-related protein 11-domain-containing protein [Massariosphaeria phaeospora]|uniref:Autophagy-related protein 11 n=1 Tax=Massariosphaeria phaeospora TaxID=100035 RepID=A0A7C8M991_9PLEO|nr:autophagy-related protein 11-domain-containing protein [Massariosphaeria phaeospora]